MSPRRLLPLLALAVALIALPACGGGGTSDASGDQPSDAPPSGVEASGTFVSATTAGASNPGAAVFRKASCASCHTLAVASATGTSGPTLDGLSLSAELIRRQVENGGKGMPAFSKSLSKAEIAAVAEYVVASSAAPTAKPASFKPDGMTLATCKTSGGGDCYRQAFGNLAYDDGPKAALEEFAREITTSPVVEATCHPIAHTIGAAALLYYKGDVGKAFADGNAACGSGYYHGLLEWKLAGVPPSSVSKVARTVCNESEIRVNAFIYYQCNHGLGHGLMLYTRYDLPDALKLCHRLNTTFDQISCTGGVFMENQQSSYGITSRWLRKDNLLYPCNIVSHADKLYCYLLVTSQILPKVGYDWKKAANWCRKSDKDFVSICFQSYGRDASGTAREDPVKIRETCAQAGSGERECLFGAVRDILNNNATDLRGRQLCEAVSSANRAYCFFGIGSILGTVHPTAAARQAACASFAAPRDRNDCLSGAGAAAA